MTQVAAFVAGESGSLEQLERALWHTRYTVLLQLRHCRLRALDTWTVEPAPVAGPAAAEADRLLTRLHEHGAIRFQT